jgi:hypothetical protein
MPRRAPDVWECRRRSPLSRGRDPKRSPRFSRHKLLATGCRIVCGVRFGVVLTILLLTLAAPAAGATLRWYWPMAKVMRLIDDTRIRVGTRAVRIHSETTLCSGERPSVRRQGIRRWSRFSCTFTTFTRQGLDRDLDFRVRVVGRRRFVITDAHWVRAAR